MPIKKNINPTPVAGSRLIGPFQIFAATYKTFKGDSLNFILNTVFRVVAILPLITAAFLYAIIFSVFSDANVWLLLFFGILYLAGFLASIYLIIRSDIQLLSMFKNPGGKFWEVFKGGKKYFWTYVFLIATIVFVIFLGSLLFILPGVILAILASLILYVTVFEDLAYWPAIKRGVSLAWHNFFGILIRFLLLILGFFLVYFILRNIFTPFLENGIVLMFYGFLSQMVFYIGYTFFMIYTYEIYKSLAIKK